MASDLLKLLPRSLRQDPVLAAIAEAAEIQLKQAYQEAEAIYNLVDINKMPEALLDLLAFEKHVDFYEASLPVEQKRELIKASIKWHRKKGTRGAVEDVVSIIYKNARVFEWFEYGGEEYSFQIEIDEPFIAHEDMQRLRKMVDATKNKRSWLEFIAIRAFSENLSLINKYYQFPVNYPICNMFQTETLPGKLADGNISIGSNSYTFDTSSPICNTFVTATVNSAGSRLNVELANEYRNVDVLYHRASQNIVVGEGEI